MEEIYNTEEVESSTKLPKEILLPLFRYPGILQIQVPGFLKSGEEATELQDVPLQGTPVLHYNRERDLKK